MKNYFVFILFMTTSYCMLGQLVFEVKALLPLKEVGAIFYALELTIFLFLPKELWKWRYNLKYDYILSDTYDLIEKM